MTVSDGQPKSNPQAFSSASDSIPSGKGKSQPWKDHEQWPPKQTDLVGVTESRGQLLLLDGTGGSGTVAVPNAVTLPPKTKE